MHQSKKTVMHREPSMQASPWYDFSQKEKDVLRLSWHTVGSDQTEMEALGTRIYEMIFNQSPDARRLFPYMRFNGREKDTTAFTFQALRFVQVLESAIKNLDNLCSLDNILDNLGRRHGKLESSSGFHKCYWSVFLECAIYNLRHFMEKPLKKKAHQMTSDEVDEAVVMWRILLRNVIDRIEVGYEKDLANRGHGAETPIAEYGRTRAPKLSEYSRSSSMAMNKSVSTTSFSEMVANLNPFKGRKNSGEK
uniref:GLOBIN domain-containing protein n=1 Tax=Panagrellus redivivus TaxID=6233 RepID=A0A7E4V5W8_PANRE